MSASDEPRCNRGCDPGKHGPECIWPTVNISNEPRTSWKEIRRTAKREERGLFKAYAEVGRLLTDENAPVLADVLAEVARQDAGGAIDNLPALSKAGRYMKYIQQIGFEIREARSLKAEGGAT